MSNAICSLCTTNEVSELCSACEYDTEACGEILELKGELNRFRLVLRECVKAHKGLEVAPKTGGIDANIRMNGAIGDARKILEGKNQKKKTKWTRVNPKSKGEIKP